MDLILRSGHFSSFLPGKEREVTRVRVLRLTPTLVLLLYGEFQRGALLQLRIRYLRTDDLGGVRTDALLRPTYDPPR